MNAISSSLSKIFNKSKNKESGNKQTIGKYVKKPDRARENLSSDKVKNTSSKFQFYLFTTHAIPSKIQTNSKVRIVARVLRILKALFYEK